MKVLLDEHLPKAVAVVLNRTPVGAQVHHIADWQSGRWLGEEDPVLLEGLWEDRRVLVSYDRATLPGCLAQRIADGENHAGIIFLDQERFPVNRIGDMARVLGKLLKAYPSAKKWTNRIVTLTR